MTTVVTLSTNIAASGELAKGSMVTKILATEALRDGVLGLWSLKGHTEVEESSDSTKRLENVLVVSQNPERKEALGANPSAVDFGAPHLANGRNRNIPGSKFLKNSIRGSIRRKTTEDRLGDMTNHGIVSEELQLMSSSCTEDRLIFGQGRRANSNTRGTIDQAGISHEKGPEERQNSISKAKGDRRNPGLKGHRGRRRRGIWKGGINSLGGKSSKAIGDDNRRRRRSRTSRTRRFGKNKRRIGSQRNFITRRLKGHEEMGEPAGRKGMAGEGKATGLREQMKAIVATFPRKGKVTLGRIKEISGSRIGKVSIIAKVVLISRSIRIIGEARNSKGSRRKRRRKRMGGRLRTVISPNNGHGGGRKEEETRPPPGRVTARKKGKRSGQRQERKDESQDEESTFSRRSATKKAGVYEEAAARKWKTKHRRSRRRTKRPP